MVIRTEMVNVDGVCIRTRLSGSGRPLLLINGIGCPLETWAPLVRHLRGFEVLTFDPPGIGRSSRPRWPMRLAGHGRIVAGLADHFGWRSFDLLGVSWGGTLAQQFARDHPGRVRRLVLCGTTFGLGGYSANPLVVGLMSNPFRHASQGMALAVAPALYGDDVKEAPEGYREFVRAKGAPNLRGYYEQVYAISGWTSLPWLHRLQMPTLVLAATNDQVIPARNADVLARRIPRARLAKIAGGHLFPLLKPRESARVIRAFLNEREPEEVARTA